MVMKNSIIAIFICINILIIGAAGVMVAGLYHDINTLRHYNENLRQSLAAVQQDQEAIEKDVRLIKNDSDLIFRMVVSGEYIAGEK